MDSFFDRINHKVGSGDSNLKSQVGDSKELNRLKQQITGYEALLREMRKITAINQENASNINTLTLEGIDAIEEANSECKLAISDIIRELKELKVQDASSDVADRSNSVNIEDYIHRENVKVYRNVQASTADQLLKTQERIKNDFGDALRQSNDDIKSELANMLREALQNSEEDGVDDGEELSKEINNKLAEASEHIIDELTERFIKITEVKKQREPKSSVKPLLVITMIGMLINVAICITTLLINLGII